MIPYIVDPPPDFVLGLDLGKVQDPTALAILERRTRFHPERLRWQNHYGIRYLKRWPLGTNYSAIVSQVAELVKQLPAKVRPMLAVDETGVGKAVIEMVKAAQMKATISAILITSGSAVTFSDGSWHVPKKELVSVLQVLLQGHRLKVADLPERETLVKEFTNFKVKITTAGNETFEAWRERDHDDLVLAVALACWLGERVPVSGGPPPGAIPGTGAHGIGMYTR